MEKRGNTNAKGIKKSFRGGGNRLESSPQRGEEAIVHERLARVTSAGEGEITAKFVKDVRSIRRKGDKFETEKVVLVDSSNEHESIVGWGCYPTTKNQSNRIPHPNF